MAVPLAIRLSAERTRVSRAQVAVPQHLELAANYPKIRVGYTQIVTISTDNILKTNKFRDSVGAQWTVLSDAGVQDRARTATQ